MLSCHGRVTSREAEDGEASKRTEESLGLNKTQNFQYLKSQIKNNNK